MPLLGCAARQCVAAQVVVVGGGVVVVVVGGGGGDEYDDGGRGWVVCQGICGGAMLEVTTPIICLGLEAIM